jgi:hypothetical protein
MKKSFFAITLGILITLSITQYQRKTYWKEQYINTSVWADTLYEQNLKLYDSLHYYQKEFFNSEIMVSVLIVDNHSDLLVVNIPVHNPLTFIINLPNEVG